MFTRGEFTVDNVTYGAIMSHTKSRTEAILITSGTVVSAYLVDDTGSYSYNNVRAKEMVQLVQNGVKASTSKNCVPMPFELGAMNQHEFIKSKVEYTMQLYRGEVVGAFIQSSDKRIEMEYVANATIPDNIPYVKLTEVKKNVQIADNELDAVQTRSVQEIALEKEDITWLQNKKYFIVNDDETAEKIFTFLDSYNGPIAYDTETTGLKINCFGQINSKYQHDLEKYNAEHSDNPIRADKLVGIIFCIEENTSYYFPCFNRKFKNLYQDLDSPIRKKIINNTKSRYTIGDLRNVDNCVADYWRKTSENEITPDCVLMERVRNILEKKHILAHNGSFEYKVGMQYWIDTNLKDDTMLLHQVAYKFRNGGGKAEPSNLKYLAKKELGVDQWELHDFFPNWKPDKEGLVRRKPGAKNLGTQIDFSYMDYEGTRIYAPTDGDVTLCLFHKFKSDLLINHKEMIYIYDVEVLVACAVGYMEFYGHRIDESKILNARAETMANKSTIVSEVRQLIDYADEDELNAYNNIKDFRDNKKTSGLSEDEFNSKLIELVGKLDGAIEANTQKQINLGSPAQVCDLFYNKLGIPFSGDKQSVAKKEVKALLKEKNDDGTPKYPVVHLYSKYKNEETLLSKFFDNLIYFTYPGGFIFSSFGQIATNTGRMSCKQPNCQQYPKVITKIIIPRDGYVMMDADYSQIEYRVLTAMAGNEWLAELFSNPDSDYHTLMASLMYGVDYSAVTSAMRSAAKSFNFGIPYGMGLGSLAILLTGKNTAQTRDEAAEKMEDYFRNQPKTRKFFDNVKEMAQVNGYTKTLFNRYRYYTFTDKDGNVNNAKKAAALRQAGNAVIQGCLDGNTRIQTKEFGIMKIKDLAGYSGEVWDGEKWSHGDILYSGKKQKCIITFNTGQKFICSPIHKFSMIDYNRSNYDTEGNKRFVKCKDLVAGDKVECNMNSDLSIVGETMRNLANATLRDITIEVESVEITDEYIDMYDVCNTDGGYYVADGIITHNTAADIFKIGVARNFSFIRRNNLLGKLLIINMIHDEQLLEIDVQHLNMQRIVAEVGNNMQFKVDGFPPLYIGAGIGKAWGYAKGKMAEIHPNLLEELTNEASKIPIHRTPEEIAANPVVDTDKVIEYFDNRVYEFRRKKVADYLSNPENWHKAIYPAISGLINLQFNYGRGEDAKSYVGPNGETYNDQEFLELNIGDFLKENGINAEPKWFKAGDNKAQDEEEDKEYSEDESEDDTIDLVEGDEDVRSFTLIDESDKTFGSSIHDMINIFGACILVQQRICGISTKNMYYKKKDALIDYLLQYVCDAEDPDGLQIVFLNDANILNYTGIYVKNLDNDKLEKAYRNANYTGSDFTQGDVQNRSQAK